MRERKVHSFLGLCLEALYVEQPEQPVSFIIRFLREKYPKFADAPANKKSVKASFRIWETMTSDAISLHDGMFLVVGAQGNVDDTRACSCPLKKAGLWLCCMLYVVYSNIVTRAAVARSVTTTPAHTQSDTKNSPAVTMARLGARDHTSLFCSSRFSLLDLDRSSLWLWNFLLKIEMETKTENKEQWI